jgi:hypothetical protein
VRVGVFAFAGHSFFSIPSETRTQPSTTVLRRQLVYYYARTIALQQANDPIFETDSMLSITGVFTSNVVFAFFLFTFSIN